MTTSLKTCFKCNESQPLTEFYKHGQMADGHLNKCKACTRRDSNRNRRRNIDKIQAYDRMRYRRDEYRRRQLRSLYWARTPDQKKCNYLVGNAIRDGRMTRPDGCWYCGKECKPEAHHSFYDPERFDVVTWLCRSCHVRAHKVTEALT